MKINFKQIFFTIIIIIATALIAVFIYDYLTSLDTGNIANVTTQNTNVVLNNQISARDLKNVTNTITSDKSTTVYNNTSSSSGWVLPVLLLGGAVLVVTLIGISFCVGAMDAPSAAVEAIEMNVIS